ncbi:hypothetical protein IC229_18470 [Spirosoma sp. BT702]|uniref:Uncharacterized protein n=1 Tax=Spirosoma profusum TaxID=2771354 RepID=A0A926XXH3_9BACT|nr:hypothetical protein [Spirosoma profusum]MBD2702638.1 hypothetical protein [Spirosoma profusum]
MVRTHFDSQYEYFVDFFQGKPVKMMRDRKTGELLFDAESVAPILGFASAEEMFSNDAVLDLLNEQITKGQGRPIRRM